MRAALAIAAGLVALLPVVGRGAGPAVVIGSKNFTESVVLGEIARGAAAAAGVPARHRSALGGTRIVYNALVSGEIDAYIEYTGTLTHEIHSGRNLRSLAELGALLAESDLRMTRALGFRDNYALGIPDAQAERLGLTKISDLRSHPGLVFRFSNEFVDRADGWPGLRDRYGLPQQDVRGVEHDLAYRGMPPATST